MAAAMCLFTLSIFVLKWNDVHFLSQKLTHFERSVCRVKVFHNGFLICCAVESVFHLCTTLLHEEGIFYEAWVGIMLKALFKLKLSIVDTCIGGILRPRSGYGG